jgi:hypothetical protein
MEHTSQSHRCREGSPTRRKSSRRTAKTTNDDCTRDRDVKSPAKAYYPSGRKVDRSGHRSSRQPRSPRSGSGTEIRQSLRMHLPSYPPNIGRADMINSMRHEQLSEPRPEGSRRITFNFRYERETEATVRHIFIDKPGDQGWLHAIGIPRIVTDGRRQSNDGTWSRPEAANIHSRRRYHHSHRTDVSRERGKSSVEGKASSRSHSDEAMSRLTTANLESCTKSAEREYRQSLRTMPNQTVVANGEATTRRTRNSDSKAKSSGPQTSQLPAHRVRHSPDQEGSSPLAAGLPDGGGSQATEEIRGTGTERHPDDEAMTSPSKDSVFAYDFNPPTPTPEPVDEKRPRRDHTSRRSGNKDPSRSKRTKPGGHRPRYHPRPDNGGSYTYEKTKTTTTYPPPQSGCCVVL